jgi:hypothetical protein
MRNIAGNAVLLVARHRFVVAHRLTGFGAEIFHRLEVQQRVDRLHIGVGVALVHVAADVDAPVGGDGREPEIDDDHHQDRNHIAPVEGEIEHAQDHREFDDGRHAGQHAHADDLLDGLATALEHARQTSGLALKMKAQRQIVQVDKDFVGDAPHRMHRDRGKQGVAPLGEKLHEAA